MTIYSDIFSVATNPTIPTIFTEDTGTAIPAANALSILGGAGIATSGSGNTVTITLSDFSVVIRQFIANGTYTPTTGMIYCQIEVVGAGGGGGGTGATGPATIAFGGGGASGEYARGTFSSTAIGASQAITCPAGGAGGIAGANNGTAGGTTSVGALISAGGGSGGIGAAANTTGTNGGGAGGTGGSGGTLRFSGQPGRSSFWNFGTVAIPGGGAAGVFSGGTQGSGATATGATGVGFGGGGGGATASVNAAALAGGPGSSGIVVITEYVII